MTEPVSSKFAKALETPTRWTVTNVFVSGRHLARSESGQWDHVEQTMTAYIDAEGDPDMRGGLNGTLTVFNRDFKGVPERGETLVLTMIPSPYDPGDVSRITDAVTVLHHGTGDEAKVTGMVRIPKVLQPT